MQLPDLNWNQYKAIGRHALTYTAGAVTMAAAVGLLSQGDAGSLTNGLNQIADGLAGVAKGVAAIAGVLVPIYTAYKASHSASPQEQIKTVAAMPEVKGIVTTPAVAAASPSDKVVTTPAEIPATVAPVAKAG
jgi:hypothetical protein